MRRENCGVDPPPPSICVCGGMSVWVCCAQVGFIEFAVAPLYAGLLQIFPAMHPCMTNLFANRDEYARRHIRETKVTWCCCLRVPCVPAHVRVWV